MLNPLGFPKQLVIAFLVNGGFQIPLAQQADQHFLLTPVLLQTFFELSDALHTIIGVYPAQTEQQGLV